MQCNKVFLAIVDFKHGPYITAQMILAAAMSAIAAKAVSWTESGLVPDSVIRAGIRRLLESNRRQIHSGDIEFAANTANQFVAMMNASPIALVPELANEQREKVRPIGGGIAI